MLYVRGNAWDYDNWQAMGNPGWSYQDVLPYFIKAEHNHDIHNAFHGNSGPLHVTNPTDASDLNQRFIEGMRSTGYTG